MTLLLVFSYIYLPVFSFPGGGIEGYMLYSISHANIWHLLANILCLWMIPCPLHLLVSFLLAALCSFLPCFVTEPTMGFSGVLFSMVGISWGMTGRFRDMLWKNKWFLVIPIFVPHVNAFIHLYCIVVGYLAGVVYGRLSFRGNEWI